VSSLLRRGTVGNACQTCRMCFGVEKMLSCRRLRSAPEWMFEDAQEEFEIRIAKEGYAKLGKMYYYPDDREPFIEHWVDLSVREFEEV
jgi:hypothetical protein